MPANTWPLIGNPAAVEQLRGAIVAGRVAHAYLISGQPRIGKRTLAEIFSRALLCREQSKGVPCGTCIACRKVARGVHPDVEIIDLEHQQSSSGSGKNTGVTIESVRAVSAQSALRPMEGAWRVTVIADAETMQEAAQEALLKTLEEPPPYCCILLLATDAEALLPTVRSRCQSIELRPATALELGPALIERSVDPGRIDEIVSLAGGSPGWALQAAGDSALVRERLETVDQALAWIESDGYRRLVTAVQLGDRFAKKRSAVFQLLETTLSIWRDLLLRSAGSAQHATYVMRSDRLAAGAGRWNLAEIHRAARSVRLCLTDLDANVRPRLALEAMVLQWPNP